LGNHCPYDHHYASDARANARDPCELGIDTAHLVASVVHLPGERVNIGAHTVDFFAQNPKRLVHLHDRLKREAMIERPRGRIALR
jgi:hypothetical protein